MREAGTDLFRFMALSGQTAGRNFGSRLQLVKIEPQVKRLRLLLATEAVGCGGDRLRRSSRSTYERSDLSQGRGGARLPNCSQRDHAWRYAASPALPHVVAHRLSSPY
jgi:hypothetical protein